MRRLTAPVAVLALALIGVLSRPAGTAPPDGRALFERACRGCHSGDDPRAPSPEALHERSPQAIVDALTAGSMRYQGLALSGDERRAVAEYLAGRRLRGTVTGTTIGTCGKRPPLGDLSA